MHMKYVRSRAHECVYIIADYFKQSLRLVVLYYNIGKYVYYAIKYILCAASLPYHIFETRPHSVALYYMTARVKARL